MIDYELALNIIVSISTVMVFFTIFLLWYYVVYFFNAGRKIKFAPHSDKKTKFAIIIAARNESKVIRHIYESLAKQTYDKDYFDVWTIVESNEDPTVEIAKEFGYQIFVRDRLCPERKTKGFAIQELTDYFVRENIIYDAYMIFDADNVLDDNYIEIMNDLRQTGVTVGLGYRNFTNANENWLTSCSAVMFTYMNQVTNRGRSRQWHKCALMGTGYFVDKQIIDDAGGWIFTGMTEDIQLSSYCYYHDVNMRYYPLASFYDEQSPKIHDVHNQHIRWLFGFLESRRFLKKVGVVYPHHSKGSVAMMRTEFRLGVIPFIIYNVINCILLICSFVLSICALFFSKDHNIINRSWGITVYEFLCLYLPFIIASSYVMIKEKKALKLKLSTKIVTAATYIIFFYDFMWAFLDGLFHKKKRKSWVKIEHSGKQEKK